MNKLDYVPIPNVEQYGSYVSLDTEEAVDLAVEAMERAADQMINTLGKGEKEIIIHRKSEGYDETTVGYKIKVKREDNQ